MSSQALSSEELLITLHDGVLTLTINRPEQRNALSLSLLDQLAGQLAAHAADPAMRCVIISAAGDKAFAAGGDLKELDAIRTEHDATAMSRRGRRVLDAVRDFPVPVIAALNGLALGGGAELAMACDLRIAASHAEIGFLQGQLNVTTAWGGGIDLIAALGMPRALELLLSARRIAAAEALELGLVNRVCGAEESLEAGLADFLRPWLDRSPGVLRGYKALARAGRRQIHGALASVEQNEFVATWTHADHWDALEAAASQRRRDRKPPG